MIERGFSPEKNNGPVEGKESSMETAGDASMDSFFGELDAETKERLAHCQLEEGMAVMLGSDKPDEITEELKKLAANEPELSGQELNINQFPSRWRDKALDWMHKKRLDRAAVAMAIIAASCLPGELLRDNQSDADTEEDRIAGVADAETEPDEQNEESASPRVIEEDWEDDDVGMPVESPRGEEVIHAIVQSGETVQSVVARILSGHESHPRYAERLREAIQDVLYTSGIRSDEFGVSEGNVELQNVQEGMELNVTGAHAIAEGFNSVDDSLMDTDVDTRDPR